MSHSDPESVDFCVSADAHRASRERLAKLLMDNLSRVQQAARRKLTTKTRRVHDSPDIASSVVRRMDRLASEGRLTTLNDDEVVRFALTIARNQAVSRTRAMERFSAVTSEDGEYARLVCQRLESCADDEQATLMLYRIALGIEDATNRQIFLLRWRGLSSELIGGLLGLSAEAVRQRWHVLRTKLEQRLARGEFDEGI